MSDNAQGHAERTKNQESINLLLVGWSGNGKSATGNSILNDKVFKRNIGTESQNADVLKASCNIDGREVIVVDGINLALTRSDGTCDKERITASVNKALEICEGHISAILIVLKQGLDFSKEEAEALELVKMTLKHDILSDYGICVISHKDNFERALEDGEFKHFEDWCKMQSKNMKGLFSECKNRLVLFDNNTKDEKEKAEQKRELLDYVNQVSANGSKRFSKQVHQPPKERKESTSKEESSKLEQVIASEVHRMRQRLELTEAMEEPDRPTTESTLRELKQDVDDFERCLSQGLTQIQSLRCYIDDKLGIAKSKTQAETAMESSEPKVEIAKDQLEKIKERILKGKEEPTFLVKELENLQSKLQKDDEHTQNQSILVEIFKCKQQLKGNLPKESDAPSGLFTDQAAHKKQKTDDTINHSTRPRTDDAMDTSTSNGTLLTLATSTKEEIAIQRPDSIDLLLVGRPGNGRSATGNSILGKPKFKRSFFVSEDSGSSRSFTTETVEVEGQRIQVIDGPGLEASDEKSRELIAKLLEESLRQCSYEFTALLIVLKFGERFTHADTDAMKVIKSVLGENVIKDHSIVVVTNGDSFDREAEEASEAGQEKTSFDNWYMTQTGEAKTLFEECEFRCVLFNNNTKDDSKKAAQLGRLLEFAKRMTKYTKADFNKAEVNREQLRAEAKLPELEKETEELVENIGKEIGDLENGPLKDFQSHKLKLNDMHRKLVEHKKKIEGIGGSHKSFGQLITSTDLCKKRVESKLHEVILDECEAQDAQGQKEATHGHLHQSYPLPVLPQQTSGPKKSNADPPSSPGFYYKPHDNFNY